MKVILEHMLSYFNILYLCNICMFESVNQSISKFDDFLFLFVEGSESEIHS